MASTDKYDRQVRLWGRHGQMLLAESSVCVLGSGATAAESLKNLVLPGLGRFLLLDDQPVTESDLENNFFVTKDDLGKNRAQVVCERLQELNPDSKGEFRAVDGLSLLDSEPDFFKGFNLVLGSQLPEAAARRLADRLYADKVPLVLARTYGLIGTIRNLVPEHCIMESKPDPSVESIDDLRMSAPWPELEAYADGIDLDTVPDAVHGHVPFVAILLKVRAAWLAAHDGQPPKTFAEKDAFKAMVREAAVRPRLEEPDKGVPFSFGEEANFVEAEENAYKAYVPYELRWEIQEVLGDDAAKTLTPTTSHFWFLVAALRDFVGNEGAGQLPLGGHLPDMTATTDLFIELQRVYRSKAEKDKAAFTARLTAHLESAGLPATAIPTETVDLFVKHAKDLAVLRYRSLEEETTPATAATGELMTDMAMSEHGDNCPSRWYLALRAVDRFHATHGRYPGDTDATVDTDAAAVFVMINDLCKELSLDDHGVTEKHAQEMTRYGGCEPHNVAAIMGGVAAQEMVKFIVRQFMPLVNTYVFNGIITAASTLEL